MFQLTEANKGTGEREESDVDVGFARVADGELAVPGEPGQTALHHPAMLAQVLARLDAAASDAGQEATPREELATAGQVVGLVGMHLAGPFASVAVALFHRRQGRDQAFELAAVVLVGCRQRDGERNAAALGDDVLLAARLPTVRGVRPDETAPFWAGTLRVSTTTRVQSSWPASPNSSSKSRCRRSQTPACCQASTRRQTVT